LPEAQRVADAATMKAGNKTPGARLRVVVERDIAIGPGKADLLEGIKETGSIAGAGRSMGMSYKRAWYLIETMNRCFKSPLVEASKGGRAGGGARLTELGHEVLARYRRMEALTEAAVELEIAALRAFVADRSDRT
jgi:molybdate transport system regulatory protein